MVLSKIPLIHKWKIPYFNKLNYKDTRWGEHISPNHNFEPAESLDDKNIQHS